MLSVFRRYRPISVGAVVRSNTQTLPGSLAKVPFGDRLLGPAPSLTKMTLQVTLDPRNPAALAAMAQAVSTPGSPAYHHFLTPSEVARRYGPTPATIAAVASALKAEGLTVGAVSGTGLSLTVKATVARVESAFSTPIAAYRLPTGGVGYDNEKSPSVPTSVASRIQGVLGLDTLDQPTSVDAPMAPVRGTGVTDPVRVSPLTSQPTPTSSCISGIDADEQNGALDADDLAQAYSFGSLYAHNDYGSGSTVALVELADSSYSPSDIATFANCYGITVGPNQITEENVDGASNVVGVDTTETELDIETSCSFTGASGQYRGLRRHEQPL